MIWIYIMRTGDQENPKGSYSGEKVSGANYMPRYQESYSQ